MTYDSKALAAKIQDGLAYVPIGSTWQHFKGGIYLAIGVVVDTNDGKLLVKYRRIAGPGFDAVVEAHTEFARPLREFFEVVAQKLSDPPIRVDRFMRLT